MTKPFEARHFIGQKVRIYRNLHNGLMSVQAKVNGRWLVIGHTADIALRDVSFRVSQAGRERVLREGRKNVHAYIIGSVFLPENILNPNDPIRYNPRQANYFTNAGGEPIYQAEICLIRDCKPAIA